MIIKVFTNFLRALGKTLVSFLASLGDLTTFILKSIYHCFVPPFYFRLFFKHILDIGFYSLPVVGLTTLFAGMVIALQTYSGFSGFKAESVIASVVLISVTRELAPVLSALMVAGRIGAAMAAEIGTMKVTEQVDALRVMAANPVSFLVVPRFIAIVLMMPVLVVFANLIGNIGGWIVAHYYAGISTFTYENSIKVLAETYDMVGGMIKSSVFGAIIAIVGCYKGLNAPNGAEGVGLATTASVVLSIILIFITNYFLSILLYV